MTNEEIIAVVTEHGAGKRIEHAFKGSQNWNPITSPLWNFAEYNYRLATEPKRIWVNEYPSGLVLHQAKGEAEAEAGISVIRIAIPYIEEI